MLFTLKNPDKTFEKDPAKQQEARNRVESLKEEFLEKTGKTMKEAADEAERAVSSSGSSEDEEGFVYGDGSACTCVTLPGSALNSLIGSQSSYIASQNLRAMDASSVGSRIYHIRP
jgi:hypothetical protein